jgi:hypothetical protein
LQPLPAEQINLDGFENAIAHRQPTEVRIPATNQSEIGSIIACNITCEQKWCLCLLQRNRGMDFPHAPARMSKAGKMTFQDRPALAKILDGFYAGFSEVSSSIYVRNPLLWCPILVLFWAPFSRAMAGLPKTVSK